MGRNSHNKIRNGNFKNRKFNIKGIKRYVDRLQKAEETAILLNAVLLIFPWAMLFASGVLVSPVYAQGENVSTDLDTMLFIAGGIGVFVLVLVFSVLLKGKSKKGI